MCYQLSVEIHAMDAQDSILFLPHFFRALKFPCLERDDIGGGDSNSD